MKILILVAAMLLGLQSLFAQISSSEIIGAWKVNKVLVDSSRHEYQGAPPQLMDSICRLLKTMTLNFYEDGRAVVQSRMKEMNIAKGYWKLNSVDATILIVPWEERNEKKPSLLMGMFISKTNEEALNFALEETPFMLSVERLKSIAN